MNKNHCKQENIRLGTHGEDYGSWMSNPVFYIIGGIMEQVHRVVLSHLDYDGEGKILEVGCGSGALTIRSALTWPKAKVIGVDHWGAVYNYSKALCEKNAAREGVPFSVQVDILDLNIRTGAGTNYAKTGETTGKGVFTIVEVKAGQGASAGWGRLKSGAGWISLDYATRLA